MKLVTGFTGLKKIASLLGGCKIKSVSSRISRALLVCHNLGKEERIWEMDVCSRRGVTRNKNRYKVNVTVAVYTGTIACVS